MTKDGLVGVDACQIRQLHIRELIEQKADTLVEPFRVDRLNGRQDLCALGSMLGVRRGQRSKRKHRQTS